MRNVLAEGCSVFLLVSQLTSAAEVDGAFAAVQHILPDTRHAVDYVRFSSCPKAARTAR